MHCFSLKDEGYEATACGQPSTGNKGVHLRPALDQMIHCASMKDEGPRVQLALAR